MKLTTKNIIIILLCILAVNTVQNYVLYITRKFGDIDFFELGTHFFSFVNSLLSVASTILAWRLLKKYTRARRAVLTFLLALAIFAVFTSVFYLAERGIINGLPTNFNLLFGNFVFSFITVHLSISAYSIAFLYFVYSRELELNVRRLEEEKIKLSSEQLKQNLEPHFLFNNLSILTSLIKTQPEKVDDFMDNFSEVYRYYLKHNDAGLVRISEEMVFLNHYLELVTARFGNAYQLNFNISDSDDFILPCSLQLCVENAIKHNFSTENNPLQIYIYQEEDFLIVKNEVRKTETVGTGIGNVNLARRYEILLDKKIEFHHDEKYYIVKIPVVTK